MFHFCDYKLAGHNNKHECVMCKRFKPCRNYRDGRQLSHFEATKCGEGTWYGGVIKAGHNNKHECVMCKRFKPCGD